MPKATPPPPTPTLSRPSVPIAVAAGMLYCSTGTLYNWMARGKLSWTKAGCHRRIYLDSIEAMLAANTVEATAR